MDEDDDLIDVVTDIVNIFHLSKDTNNHIIDRHHSFRSGNIPKTERCQIHLNVQTV